MKVLMISGDKNLLNPESDAGKRLALQRVQVEQLDVFVWPQAHSWWKIFTAALRNDYDVITAQDPFFRGVLAWKLTWFMRAKLNIQVHTDLSAYTFLRHVLARFVLHRADSVRVVSEKIRIQVQNMGVKAPVHLLPIYVDIERYRSLTPIKHSEKTILWIGRFEAEKAPVAALEVLRGVLEQGVVAKLIMLGTGALEPVLRRAAEGFPVEFPGWRDPVEYLPTADMVLCTSLHESWGASIVEALAAGVPVVAPDVGVAREAGAIVVARQDMTTAVYEVLVSGVRGTLCISLLDKDVWLQRWIETLG